MRRSRIDNILRSLIKGRSQYILEFLIDEEMESSNQEVICLDTLSFILTSNHNILLDSIEFNHSKRKFGVYTDVEYINENIHNDTDYDPLVRALDYGSNKIIFNESTNKSNIIRSIQSILKNIFPDFIRIWKYDTVRRKLYYVDDVDIVYESKSLDEQYNVEYRLKCNEVEVANVLGESFICIDTHKEVWRYFDGSWR